VSDAVFVGDAAVKVRVVVGGAVSPVVTVTDVGLKLQVGGVAAVTGSPWIAGRILQDRLIVP
jgi:hypothetical protein